MGWEGELNFALTHLPLLRRGSVHKCKPKHELQLPPSYNYHLKVAKCLGTPVWSLGVQVINM